MKNLLTNPSKSGHGTAVLGSKRLMSNRVYSGVLAGFPSVLPANNLLSQGSSLRLTWRHEIHVRVSDLLIMGRADIWRW